MLHASTQQLIRKLHELTEAGGLAWKEGERETSRLETEGYIVEVEATPPGLRLLRGDGRELEKATADDLAAVAWPAGEGATYATRVAEMAARAHRIARGAEQAIATILSSLSAPAKAPAPQPTAPQPAAAAVPPEQPKPPAPIAASPPIKPPPAPALPPDFGQTTSFAKPEPQPPAAQEKPADPPLPPVPKKPAPDALIQGLSARSVQHVEQALPADLQRFAPPPKPALQPVVPSPTPRAPAATGPDVYKPWN